MDKTKKLNPFLNPLQKAKLMTSQFLLATSTKMYVQVVLYNLQLLPILMLLKCTLLGSLFYLSLLDRCLLNAKCAFQRYKQKTPFIDIAIVNSVTYVVSLIHESY